MNTVVGRDEAVRLLRAGGVVAVPTDTVYGLAASLDYADAGAEIFSMKRRPSTVALPVLVDSVASIERLGVTLPRIARTLSDAFWPGALTIVVDVPLELARRVGGEGDTIGFRLPDDELLREVLAKTGPLVVSSANEHAAPPCHNVEQVLTVFGESETLKAVLDGGERAGEVSTVVQVQGDALRILREGAIGSDEVRRVLA
jgi:tRNA threonylcarbamoyl adenosine modification protein (Sua5/YciO/YrdC/YwlC family)